MKFKKYLKFEVVLPLIFLTNFFVGAGWLDSTIGNFLILALIVSSYVGFRVAPFFFLVIFLVFTMFASIFYNFDVLTSGGLNTVFLFFLSLPLLFIKVDRVVWRGFIVPFVALMIIVLVIIYYYYIFGLQSGGFYGRLVLMGPYSNQNQLAMFLLSLMLVALVYYRLNSKSGFSRNILYLISMIFYCSIILTQSRSAILAATFFLAMFFNKRFLFVFVAVPTVLMLSFFYENSILERLVERTADSGTSGRSMLWLGVINDLIEHPTSFLFGMGPNNALIYQSVEVSTVHNSYLNFLANYGILSFFVLMVCLVYILWSSYKCSVFLFYALIASLIHAVFETSLFSGFSPIWLAFLFLFATRNRHKEAISQFKTN